jgi:hypothetical protein
MGLLAIKIILEMQYSMPPRESQKRGVVIDSMVIPTFKNNSNPVSPVTTARQTDQEINSLIFIFLASAEEILAVEMFANMPDSDRLRLLAGF